MSYEPGLNGGRINATVGGNTAGAGALVSTGTLNLMGGNNITLSQNGQSISIVGTQSVQPGIASIQASNTTYTSGKVIFSNANGMSFGSSAGSAITASYTVPTQSNQTGGIYGSSQTVGQSSSSTYDARSLSIVGQGGVSVGMSGGSLLVKDTPMTVNGTSNSVSISGGNNITVGNNASTITISAANQSNQSVGLYAGSNTTVNSSGTADARSITFAGAGGVSVEATNGSVVISGAAAGGGGGTDVIGMSNLGNSAGTSGVVSNSAVQYYIAGGTNITLNQSLNGNSGTLSIQGDDALTGVQILSGPGIAAPGGLTVGTTGVITQGAFALQAGDNIFLSQSSGANSTNLQIHAGVNGVGMANLGNSSGQSGTHMPDSGVTLVGGNNVTLSQSTANNVLGGVSATVTVNAANQTNQTVGLYAASNTTQSTSATVDARSLTFAGAGGVSVGATNGSVVISGGAGGAGGVALYDGAASISSGTASFADGNNVSFGINGQTVTGSANYVALYDGANSISSGTANFVDSHGVSFGINGQTVTASVTQLPTLSRWEYPDMAFTSLPATGQGSLSINHMYVPFNVTATAAKIGGSLSAATNTSATTASANISLWMGIYTLNGSTLSLASSGSANNGFQWSQTASSTGNTSINSMRQMTVPMNINMTPGEYWVGAVMSSATTYTSYTFTLYGNTLINPAAGAAVLTPIGSNTTANRDAVLFQGLYTANTSAGPATIVGAGINNTAASAAQRANFYLALFNATY